MWATPTLTVIAIVTVSVQLIIVHVTVHASATDFKLNILPNLNESISFS